MCGCVLVIRGLSKLPSFLGSACVVWHLWWGHSKLRLVKLKHEIHRTQSCQSVRSLPKSVTYLGLGIFASSIISDSISLQKQPKSVKPKEHFAFSQKTSSSVRNRSDWLFQLVVFLKSWALSKCCGNQVGVAPATLFCVVCHLFKFLPHFFFLSPRMGTVGCTDWSRI